ncbi:MAG: hypothetical protein HQK79_03995 [Desulfobacterales bacterium]|nr:hypothetical protein [Desulfobacterales bacterium]
MIKESRSRKVISLTDYVKGKKTLEDGSIKDVDELVKKGLDPLHAIYVSVQNFTSAISELLSELSIFEEFYDIVTSVEEKYLKQGITQSPITKSYFTTWAFFDLCFGQDNETIGTCILDVSKELNLSSIFTDVIKIFQLSRMGIYTHCGSKGPKVLFKELLTEEEYYCHVASGYLGEKGQIWFIRVLPPLTNFDYSVIFTTPYILKTSKKGLSSFLARTIPKTGINIAKNALYHFMKYGLNRNYWHEYICNAYKDSQYNAIFLSGVPDIKRNIFPKPLDS